MRIVRFEKGVSPELRRMTARAGKGRVKENRGVPFPPAFVPSADSLRNAAAPWFSWPARRHLLTHGPAIDIGAAGLAAKQGDALGRDRFPATYRPRRTSKGYGRSRTMKDLFPLAAAIVGAGLPVWLLYYIVGVLVVRAILPESSLLAPR